MMNPLNNNMKMISQNPNMAQYKQMYQMFKNAGNPIQMFTNMAQNNPQLKPILQAINSGTSPQQIFNSMCQQKGIDPNEFIKNITG